MLGDLPSDFLRIQLIESQVYDPFLAQQDDLSNPNFLGYFTLTIAEVNFRKKNYQLFLFCILNI